MVEFANVTKAYPKRRGAVRALDAVSLRIEKGEFVAVRGPSGSGKSTLLLTAGAMNHPTTGAVTVDGRSVYALSGGARAAFRARRIGFVFQMFHLVPHLTVLENVLLPTRLAPDSDGPTRALELLGRFGLGDRLGHRPAELSTGERQRTAVARALVNRPGLVLADEPTGNLDPDSAEEILGYLGEFHAEGGTVLMVTHQDHAAARAQRTVVIREGKVTEA